eukprot:493158-Prymnesium_polylepis.1
MPQRSPLRTNAAVPHSCRSAALMPQHTARGPTTRTPRAEGGGPAASEAHTKRERWGRGAASAGGERAARQCARATCVPMAAFARRRGAV